MSTVEEITAAIERLSADDVARVRTWLAEFAERLWDNRTNVEEFRRLADDWKSQSEFLASPTAIAALPAYQAIIEMGRAAVPLILGELRREPDHWFVALKRITGEDPVPEDGRGDLDRMAEAWLKWGRDHGIEGQPPALAGISAPRSQQP